MPCFPSPCAEKSKRKEAWAGRHEIARRLVSRTACRKGRWGCSRSQTEVSEVSAGRRGEARRGKGDEPALCRSPSLEGRPRLKDAGRGVRLGDWLKAQTEEETGKGRAENSQPLSSPSRQEERPRQVRTFFSDFSCSSDALLILPLRRISPGPSISPIRQPHQKRLLLQLRPPPRRRTPQQARPPRAS